jgi:hypothetical protein
MLLPENMVLHLENPVASRTLRTTHALSKNLEEKKRTLWLQSFERSAEAVEK